MQGHRCFEIGRARWGRPATVSVVEPRVEAVAATLNPQRSAIAAAVIVAIAGKGAVLREDQALACLLYTSDAADE